MPIGYTALIKDGIDFKTYAMGCARAFGACIMLRDEPADVPIPERFEPSDYHLDKIEDAKAALTRAEAMTKEEAEAAAQEEYQKAVDYRDHSIWRDHQLRQKYEAMLAEVEAWEPPTPAHIDLKKFMGDQIRESIGFDCGWHQPAPTLKSPMEFKAAAIEAAKRDLAYHTKEYAAEVERAEGRTAWVKALRDSLSVPVGA